MNLIIGFKEHLRDCEEGLEDKCGSSKLVPWISWDEWKFVKESLFSSSPSSVVSALQRISTWRGRGCIPIAIEVTASIIEIQQKDSFFRNDMNESAYRSEEMLAMLYCMAIMRLVNGVVEKTRKKNEVSIGEAADAIGIPRMIIDIRHEGSHRDLPSLQLVRLASKKALDWLVSYYWEHQEKEIPVQSNQTANLRKEIKRKLREVALCLTAKQMAKSSSSHAKGKRLKKQLAKSLKHTLRLHSSFSPEVINLLLEYLLITLDSTDSAEAIEENKQTAFDDWKSVVLKLSSKEPEVLLSLTQAVLEKMEEIRGTTDHELDDLQSPEISSKYRQMELLSCLFECLTGNLKTLNPVIQKESAENKGSKTDKILERCLLVSSPENKHLMTSALTLAPLKGDSTLLHKLKKLSLLELLDSKAKSVDFCNETTLSQLEDSIRQAEEKFELIRCSQLKNRNETLKHSQIGTKSRWAVAKSWNPCPIGMIPHTIGFRSTSNS